MGWAYHKQLPTVAAVSIFTTGLIIGNEDRFGKTVWQSMDAFMISSAITTSMKNIFQRVRPADAIEKGTGDQWFKSGNDSFPSGHTASMTALVTPFVLEYAQDKPLVNLLWLLPLHQAVGRVEDKKHYKTDVSVGFAVGFLSGYLARKLDIPLILSWDDDGVYAGVNFKF